MLCSAPVSLGPLEIILGILGISLLVVVHELGHYLTARMYKMRVLRFSIGFGPTIFRYQPKGSPTTFVIGAIPLMAYVQVAGTQPFDQEPARDPDLFQNKSLFSRIVNVAAGSGANYLLAVVLGFFLALAGWPEPKESHEPLVIASIAPGSAAAEAGLRPGDVLHEADSKPVRSVSDLAEITGARAGVPTIYTIERARERLTITMTPRDDGNGRGRIGVAAEQAVEYVSYGVPEAAEKAVVYPLELTVATLGALRSVNADSFAGPKRMGEAVARSAQRGPGEFVQMLIALSVALGFFNLLPLPGLDGGRLAFLAYELITRKRPHARIEAISHAAGIVALLMMLVWVTYREIVG